jgi:hypothetical protein
LNSRWSRRLQHESPKAFSTCQSLHTTNCSALAISTAPASTHCRNMLSSARFQPLRLPRTTSGRQFLAQEATSTPPFMIAPQLRCAKLARLWSHIFPTTVISNLPLISALLPPPNITVFFLPQDHGTGHFPMKTATVTAVAGRLFILPPSHTHSSTPYLVSDDLIAFYSSPSSLLPFPTLYHHFPPFPPLEPHPPV